MVFVSKLINALFWGSTNFFEFSFSALALKTIDTQMLFCLPFCTGAAKVEDGTTVGSKIAKTNSNLHLIPKLTLINVYFVDFPYKSINLVNQ